MSKAVPLRVVLVFAGDNLEERHFDASETITVGSSLQATFLVPDRGRGEAFALLRPGPDGLYRVSLARQMTGKLYVGGRPYIVEEIAMNAQEFGYADHLTRERIRQSKEAALEKALAFIKHFESTGDWTRTKQ